MPMLSLPNAPAIDHECISSLKFLQPKWVAVSASKCVW